MRTCRTCGKGIEHKRAGALHCDDDCRARYGQGLRAKPPPEAALPTADPQTDSVFGSHPQTAVAEGLAAALLLPGSSVPAPAQADTPPGSTPRPPREPPVVHRPPMEHAREPELDPTAMERRLWELELRMNAYDIEQPWQDWYDDAKKLVDEAKKLVERARASDVGLRDRVERLEKAQIEAPTMTKIAGLIDDKLRHVWREIEKVDKATASRQSVEKLGEQVAGLAQSRPERRLEARPEGGEAMAKVHQRIDDLVDAHNGLQRKVLSLTKQVGIVFGRLVGVKEEDE